MTADWDAYRFVLAVAEAGSLADAGRRLRVDATTVGRRIAALERELAARLFERRERRLTPTALGTAVAARAAEAGATLAAARDAVTGADTKVSGSVRVTSVASLINYVLAARVPALARAYPDLRLELAASSSNANLSRREADVALRYARPRTGGDIVCRRIASVDYAVFAPRAAADRVKSLPWIRFDDELSELPEAAWLARQEAVPGAPAVRANELETIRRLAAAGAGKTLLPVIVGASDRALARASGKMLTREVWLLVHRDIRNLARVSAVVDWAVESFRRAAR